MILGLALFIGVHGVSTQRDFRARLIGIGGEAVFKLVYAVAAISGLLLIGFGFGLYREAGLIHIWHPPGWTKHVTALLMVLASILLVAAYSRGRIYLAVKHPMLTAVKAWAVGHLIANGDLGSIILFGTMLAWAVFDRISLKRRTDAGGPQIPVGGLKNDAIAVVGGLIVYLGLAYAFHPFVIGVSVVGG